MIGRSSQETRGDPTRAPWVGISLPLPSPELVADEGRARAAHNADPEGTQDGCGGSRPASCQSGTRGTRRGFGAMTAGGFQVHPCTFPNLRCQYPRHLLPSFRAVAERRAAHLSTRYLRPRMSLHRPPPRKPSAHEGNPRVCEHWAAIARREKLQPPSRRASGTVRRTTHILPAAPAFTKLPRP